MAQKTPESSGEEFVYSNLAAYLDDELSASDRVRLEDAAKKLNKPELPQHFGSTRGYLQMIMQDYALGEGDLHNLRLLAEDDKARQTQEATRIEAINQKEKAGNLLRRVAVVGLFLVVVFGLVYWLTPERKVPFKPLETLVYEAVAMEEDGENRFDFPTDSMAEASAFLKEYHELGFVVPALKELSGGWKTEGATVIDYEVARIGALQFGNGTAGEKLFLFMFDGQLSQLPKASPGNYKGLLYQTYENEQVNVIAWQIANGVVGLMVGHRSAPEMADLARAVSGIE